MAVRLNENREYQRVIQSNEAEKELQKRGYETVFSSNVSAIATSGDDLVIRFHNGSVYAYSKQADNYERMMAAASKGKWVWRFLIRKNVPYRRIGSLPLPDDKIVDDKEIMKPRKYDVSTIVPPDFMETGKLPQITINPILSTLAGGNDINNLGTIALLARI
jgi:hypothetical protein